MASSAFQKFKALESNNSTDAGRETRPHPRGSLSSNSSSSSKYSPQAPDPPPPKKQKRRNFIGDLANRFENDEKKKKDEEERKKFMKLEIQRQEEAEIERKKIEERLLEQERIKREQEAIELELKQKEDAANMRKEERRRQLKEDDEKYAKMKPAQALFARRKVGKTTNDLNNKENKNSDINNRKMSDIKTKYIQQIENKDMNSSKDNNSVPKLKLSNSFKNDHSNGGGKEGILDKKQSGTDMFCDLYTKGNCSNIKSIFEQNIAVKKGFIPDPTLTMNKENHPQTDLLKVAPNKVKLNATQITKQLDPNNSERNDSVKSKEYIPINKKVFTHFLDKFEDDNARQAAKAQLQQLTLEQKRYLSQEAPSWLKKQEDKERREVEQKEKLLRDEEERRLMEEQQQKFEYERQKRYEQDIEEQKKQQEIEELKEKIDREKKELQASKKAAMKAKKEAKRKSKLGSSPPAELPKIVSTTCNDIKKRFDAKRENKQMVDSDEQIKKVGGPVVRKILNNPFEKNLEKSECDSVVKYREIPALKQNRIGDIKKRYTMFMTGGSNNVGDNDQGFQAGRGDANMKPNVEQEPEIQAMMTDKIPDKPQNNILSPESFLKTKAFIRLSVEKLSNSKEKISKASKEKLSESHNHNDDKITMNKKPSKNDMQSYLISKVLFDDKKPVSVVKQNESIQENIDDDMSDGKEVVLDADYVKDMEKYLMFLDEDYSTVGKKKKKKTKKKKEEPKIQIVQVNHIKQQFETKNVVNNTYKNKLASVNAMSNKGNDLNIVSSELQGITKLRERFQFQTSREDKTIDNIDMKQPETKRVSRMINKDLLKKFDCPEMAQELKIQRDKDREERRLQRIAQLEEEKRLEEERRKEAIRLEQERLEELRLEQLRIEEEQRLEKERMEEETRLAAAYEEAVRIEKEKAAQREIKNLAIKGLREKNEPALKKKKVLGRIQHMFEKSLPDPTDEGDKIVRVGSLKGKSDGIFASSNDGNNNNPPKKTFQDPSLAGVGTVLNKFKGKFEATSEEPRSLYKGVTIKKKDIPSALIFEQKVKEQSQAQDSSPVRKNSTDWSWKKKDPKELAIQSAVATHGQSRPQKSKNSDREQKKKDQQRELLDDIHSINRRLMKKDAIKEHEQKMKEYSEFMSEIQNYLNEPDKSASEATFKDDIQNYINVVGSSIVGDRSRHASNDIKMKSKKVPNSSKDNPPGAKIGISDIKTKLSESGNTFIRKEREKSSAGSEQAPNVKSVKQKLVDQYFSQMNNSSPNCERQTYDVPNVSESISKTKDLFETKVSHDQSLFETGSTFKKKSINVPSIFTQQTNNDTAIEDEHSIRKSSYEWKYKKKSIQDFQQFLDENKEYVPKEISKGCSSLAANLTNERSETSDFASDTIEEKNIEEYNTLMKAVDTYLTAPDKTTKEIDFKSEVERYLDLIEEPGPIVPSEPNDGPAVIRRPKKLDSSQYPNASRPKSQYENLLENLKNDSTDSISNPKPTTNKAIKNLQNKLLSESIRIVEKEDVQLHVAGANQIKKTYEQFSKPEDKTLFSAPKAQIQKTFAQIKDEIVPEKTLETLKDGQKNRNWSWKKKSVRDLDTSIKMFKDHGINTPQKIEEYHKKVVQTVDHLHSKKAVANTIRDAEEINRLQDLRDQEIDNFLNEMKLYIEKPSSTNKESSLKNGITDYLDLIEDGNDAIPDRVAPNTSYVEDDNEKRNRSLPKIGQVSNIKQLLERDSQEFQGDRCEDGVSGNDTSQENKWKRGKVDTSFLMKLENNESLQNEKFVDPRLKSVNSNKIRQQLESQYSKDEEEKTLMSAPKRKLKTFQPNQVLENNNLTSTKSYLEVRAVECDYKKYKKQYVEQQEKSREKPTPAAPSTYSNISDENERKAAILAKYGCKPRPQKHDSDSSSSSSDEYDAEDDEEDNQLNENNIPQHIVQSNAMYAIYGDRLADKPVKKEKKKSGESGDAILTMLKAMRQGSQPHNPHSGGPRKPRLDSMDSSDADFSDIAPAPGSCADMKTRFEEKSVKKYGQLAPPPPQRSFSNSKNRFANFKTLV